MLIRTSYNHFAKCSVCNSEINPEDIWKNLHTKCKKCGEPFYENERLILKEKIDKMHEEYEKNKQKLLKKWKKKEVAID